jgi:hypothetical protein
LYGSPLLDFQPCHAKLGLQNQSLLASSLQTAFNLRILPDLVQSLIADLTEIVQKRIQATFDVSRISKDAISKGVCSFLR